MIARAASQSDCSEGSGGFTLLEVLIALAILSVALATLLGIFSQGLSRAREMREATTARALAQSLLAIQGTESPIVIGDTSGLDGAFAWHLKAVPYGKSETGGIGMALITAQVTWNDGKRSVSLSTLRLTPKAVLP